MDIRPNDDAQLLREFAAGQSQHAFRTLVERYQDMVFGTARRRLGNDEAASDVAQNVFAALAKKAPWLCTRASVGGWLYKSTLMEAARRQRDDLRRYKRERLYSEEMNIRGTNDHDEDAPQLAELMPVLDDAMSGLSAADREALVLRYFRGMSLRDTGVALGTTEEAARKRVSRAVEKLSGLFKRKGITVPTAVLAATLLPKVSSSMAAPAAFASKVTAAATALPAPGAAAMLYMKAAAMSKTAVATLCIAAAAVPITWQASKISSLSTENAALTADLAVRPKTITVTSPSTAAPDSTNTLAAADKSDPSRAPGDRSDRDRDRRRMGDLHELERQYQRESRLTAMAESLGLNENQWTWIAAAMEKADADRKKLWDTSRKEGKPADKNAETAIDQNREATIKAVLSEEQQEAYTDFVAAEARDRQEIFANRLLGEMQGSLHLTSEQKDQLFAVFAARAAESAADPGPWAWAQTLQEGQLENLKNILKPEQFDLWKKRIDTWNTFFKPPPPKQSGDTKPSGENK